MAELVKRSPHTRPADEHLVASSWRTNSGSLADRRVTPRATHGRGQPTDIRPRGDAGQPGVVVHQSGQKCSDWLRSEIEVCAKECQVPVEHIFALPAHVPANVLNHLQAGAPVPDEWRVTVVLHTSSWQHSDALVGALRARFRDQQSVTLTRLDMPRETRNSTLVLKNLPFALRHDMLISALTYLGVRPEYTRYYHDDRGMFKGIAFIKFVCRAAAERAKFQIEQLEVAGRRVRVEFKNKSPAGLGARGPSHGRGSPYTPPVSSPPQSRSTQSSPACGPMPSPSLSFATRAQTEQQLQQEAAAAEAFRQEWDGRLKEFARDGSADALLAISKRGMSFAREQQLRDMCHRHGLRWDHQSSTRDQAHVRTAASYASHRGGYQTAPTMFAATTANGHDSRSGDSRCSSASSPSLSPAFQPTDRAVLRQASGLGVQRARGPFDATPFPQGRGKPVRADGLASRA